MTFKKIDVDENNLTKESLVIEKDVVNGDPVIKESTTFKPIEKSPSDWTITKEGGDRISCRNAKTGRLFKGSISEFNKAFE